jgi:hypothetical protein
MDTNDAPHNWVQYFIKIKPNSNSLLLKFDKVT